MLCVERLSMTHTPITTVAEFDALDPRELVFGCHAAERDEPEPFHRCRAYWHGWRLWMMTRGRLKPTLEDRELTTLLRTRREAADG